MGMQSVIEDFKRGDLATIAAAIALVGAATIGGFFFFEYAMKLPPCPLCPLPRALACPRLAWHATPHHHCPQGFSMPVWA